MNQTEIMSRKGAVSAMLPLIPVAIMALMGILSAHQAWLVNAWSLQYTRHALNPAVKQFMLTDPPAKHDRAAFWLASNALQSGNPALAQSLIASQTAQGDPFALRLKADALLAQGNFAGALAAWKQARDFNSLQRVATLAEQNNQIEKSLMAYQAIWAMDPESGTLRLVDFLLIRKQDYGAAENVLRQSLVSFPHSKYLPTWFRDLGDALQGQKRWDEAATAYENTIAQVPDDWVAHIGLGWVKYERGDGLEAAAGEFQQAISIPQSQGNGQFALAQALAREKRFEQADAWFVQALAVNPQVRWWYVTRGNTARQAGNLALALVAYQEVLARFPDFALAHYEIAYAYQLNQKPAQAIAAIQRALALMTPPHVSYYIRAGDIYEWGGDQSHALQAYRQALLIDPQNPVAGKAVERLSK